MNFSVCIIVNKWNARLLNCIQSFSEISDEILLGCNGDFRAEEYAELNNFPNLKSLYLDWEGYGKTKNKLAQKAKNDWILSVDADEIADTTLQSSLKNFTPVDSSTIYGVALTYFVGEKSLPHGPWGSSKHLYFRLYHRQHTQWDEKSVHESVIFHNHSAAGTLPGRLNHYTAENFEELKEKNKHYAGLFAQRLLAENKRIYVGQPLVRCGFNFFRNYLLRLGFLDGKNGLKACLLMAQYTYQKYHLVRQGSAADFGKQHLNKTN